MGTLSFIKRIMRRPYAQENMSVGYPKLVYSHLFFLAEPATPFPSPTPPCDPAELRLLLLFA